jgi:glycosyltransferase involved in cell wall biosynthesis
MISVLLATYNGETYISDAIASVLNQRGVEFELLIGLNGCVDGTKYICDNYANNERVRVFDYGSEKGKSKTLNKLLNEAKYPFIALQDDDDVWAPNKLAYQWESLTVTTDVVGSFILYVNEETNIIGRPLLSIDHEAIVQKSLSGDNQIANSSAVIRKSLAISIGGWREEFEGVEDFDFYVRLIRVNAIFRNLPKYLVLHRLHKRSNFNTKKFDLSKILSKP